MNSKIINIVKHPIRHTIAYSISADSVRVRNSFAFLLDKTSKKTIMDVSHIAGARNLPSEKYQRASNAVCAALDKKTGMTISQVSHEKTSNGHIDFYKFD